MVSVVVIHVPVVRTVEFVQSGIYECISVNATSTLQEHTNSRSNPSVNSFQMRTLSYQLRSCLFSRSTSESQAWGLDSSNARENRRRAEHHGRPNYSDAFHQTNHVCPTSLREHKPFVSVLLALPAPFTEHKRTTGIPRHRPHRLALNVLVNTSHPTIDIIH